MKQTIRMNTFETNSSSTHNSIICSKEDWNKFKKGEAIWNNRMFTEEQFTEYMTLKYNELDEERKTKYYPTVESYIETQKEYTTTYEDWMDGDLEVDVTEFESESGDEIIISCAYGYDY